MSEKKKIRSWFIESPVRFYFAALVVSILIIIPLNWLMKTDPGDVLVEFHGLVFDLIVFGIILTLYETFKKQIETDKRLQKEKEDKVQRYLDNIDDYRYWHEPEAAHKIVGNIRRLNKLGQSSFDLKNCFLAEGLLQELDMSNSFFGGANLQNTPCRLSNFSGSYLASANFRNAYLIGADLRYSILGYINEEEDKYENEVLLTNTVMNDALLDGAKVSKLDWFESLKDENIEGLGQLRKKYYVDPQIIKENVELNCGNTVYNFMARYYQIKQRSSSDSL